MGRVSRKTRVAKAPVERAGVTYDTGALIALTAHNDFGTKARVELAAIQKSGIRVRAPRAVLAEWWRGAGRDDHYVSRVRAAVEWEPIGEDIAMRAGEALALMGDDHTAGISTIDAIVIAFAAKRGDRVYTGDKDDFTALRRSFQNVTVCRADGTEVA